MKKYRSIKPDRSIKPGTIVFIEEGWFCYSKLNFTSLDDMVVGTTKKHDLMLMIRFETSLDRRCAYGIIPRAGLVYVRDNAVLVDLI